MKRETAISVIEHMLDLKYATANWHKGEMRIEALTFILEENKRLREALGSIIELGRKDLSNPKYDDYFTQAKQALADERGGG